MAVGIIFAVILIIGVPVAYVLGTSSLVYVLTLDMPLSVIPQRMYLGLNSFVLLAVPMFILAGNLMGEAGITKRLLKPASYILREVRGGLSYVTIVTAVVFAGITGVGAAETAALSSILLPEMEKEGYKKDYSAALIASASIIGPIIPPSVAMVVYGSMANVSVSKLFVGGIIPGLLLGAAMMVVAIYAAKKHNYGKSELVKEKLTGKEWIDAMFGLMMPVILVGGMLTGVFMPTEAAAVAVAYSIIIGMFVYRELTVKSIIQCLNQTLSTIGSVLMIVATAALFGWILSMEGIPSKIAAQITSITNDPVIILLLVNIFLLILGMFMETLASVIMVTPVLLPMMTMIGVDPVHFGVVMVVNLSIGLLTPPLGVNSYVAAAVAKISIEQLVKAAIPFILVSILVLMLITYVPGLVMALPNLIVG